MGRHPKKVYGNWKFIQQSGLYLPSKKSLFRHYQENNNGFDSRRLAGIEKMNKAKELLCSHLKEKKPIHEVAAELGYRNDSSLSNYFKKITGITLRDVLAKERVSIAKNLLLQGVSAYQAGKQSGYPNPRGSFYDAFERHSGISISEFLKENGLKG